MIEPIKPHEPITTEHINAGIDAFNSLTSNPKKRASRNRLSYSVTETGGATPILPMYHAFEVVPDLEHPLATLENPIICAGGQVLYSGTVHQVDAVVINWVGDVWLSLDEYGQGSISQTAADAINIKIATVDADGFVIQHWKSDVCLSAGAGGALSVGQGIGADGNATPPDFYQTDGQLVFNIEHFQLSQPVAGKAAVVSLKAEYSSGATGHQLVPVWIEHDASGYNNIPNVHKSMQYTFTNGILQGVELIEHVPPVPMDGTYNSWLQ